MTKIKNGDTVDSDGYNGTPTITELAFISTRHHVVTMQVITGEVYSLTSLSLDEAIELKEELQRAIVKTMQKSQ